MKLYGFFFFLSILFSHSLTAPLSGRGTKIAHLTFEGGPASYSLDVPLDGSKYQTNNGLSISIIDIADFPQAGSQCTFQTPYSMALVSGTHPETGGPILIVGPPQPITAVTCSSQTAKPQWKITNFQACNSSGENIMLFGVEIPEIPWGTSSIWEPGETASCTIHENNPSWQKCTTKTGYAPVRAVPVKMPGKYSVTVVHGSFITTPSHYFNVTGQVVVNHNTPMPVNLTVDITETELYCPNMNCWW